MENKKFGFLLQYGYSCYATLQITIGFCDFMNVKSFFIEFYSILHEKLLLI